MVVTAEKNNVNLLNITELYMQKWVKWQILCYRFYQNKVKINFILIKYITNYFDKICNTRINLSEKIYT